MADTPPPVAISVNETVTTSDSGVPSAAPQLAAAEGLTVQDFISLLLAPQAATTDSVAILETDDIAPEDSTPPAITPTLSGTLGQNGWYTSDVHVSWTVTDAQSSISSSSGCDAVSVTTDTTGETFTCTATSAGGTSTQSVTIVRDATAPTASVALDRAPDHDPWYNRPVGWKTTGTDATSGIASCTAPDIYSGPDDENASVSGTCTDLAGNTSTTASASFRFDATAPSVTVALERGPDHGEWYNHPVDWTVTGGDDVSGATCSAGGNYDGPDTATASVSGACTNGAGLSASASTSFQYDATAPTDVLTSLSRGPDSNGWYDRAIDWATTGSDATSGIASCAGGTYSGPDSASASVAGTCTDAAGNATNATPVPFRFDSTPPPIALTTPADGTSYVLDQSAVAAYACGPDLSGVASCTGAVASGSPLATSSVGPHSFGVNASDVAGNTASKSASYTVEYAPATQSCDDAPGRTVLDPVAVDGSSVFKAGRTVPVKFRVCDANGASIGTPGLVTSFKLVQTIAGTVVDTVNDDPGSATPDTAFRWDSTSRQWIFNLDTSRLAAGKTYVYAIGLDDGTSIGFRFGLR